MKKTNRLLCLALALVMSVSMVVLSSCKGGGGNGDNSGGASEPSPHGQEVFDYGGKEVLAACYYSGIVNTSGVASSEAGQRTLDHMKYIEELYNCKFNMVVTKDMNNQIRATNMSNDVYADVFVDIATSCIELRDEGLIYPIGDVYNMENPYTVFNYSIMEAGKKDGKYYYVFGGSPNVYGVEFIPKYLDTYDIPNPYELYEQGQWTTDKYLEIVKQITKNGKSDNVYGTARINEDPMISNYLACFGTEWVSKDEDGYFKSNLNDQKILEALSWMAEVNKYAPPTDAEGAVTVFNPYKHLTADPIKSADPDWEKEVHWIYLPMSKYITEPANVAYNANVTFMQKSLGDERAKQIGAIWQSYGTYEGEWAISEEEQARLTRDDWAARCYNDESLEVVLDLRSRSSTIMNAALVGNIHVDKDLFAAGKAVMSGEKSPAQAVEGVKGYVELRVKQKNKELDK